MAARWLVMADTHWPRHGRELPAWLRKAATGADAIVHAGDLTDPALLDVLAACAPTWAVAGNGDPAGDPRLPVQRTLSLGPLRVGVTHGHLGRPGASTPERAAAAFATEPPDLVIFGHSHQPLFTRTAGLWLLNPGSPTERRRAPACTAAWLTLRGTRPHVVWIGDTDAGHAGAGPAGRARPGSETQGL